MDSAAAMVFEHMLKGRTAGLPVICSVHVQGLGRGQAADYGAYCSNQAAEGISRRREKQRKAEAGVPPMVIQPIPELDQQRFVSSKVASTCFSPCLVKRTWRPNAKSWNPPRKLSARAGG